MKKVPKYLTLILRTTLLFKQGQKSLDQGLPQAAILYFTLYIEQHIVSAACFVKREDDIDEAIKLRDNFFNHKKKYTFNRVVNAVLNIIGPHISAQVSLYNDNRGEEEMEELKKLLDNFNKIRNTVSGHIFSRLCLTQQIRYLGNEL